MSEHVAEATLDRVSAPAPHPHRALVLGGGGVTGIAWEVGILAGLADAGVDLTDADTVVGTSAGSAVGAVLATGRPLAELYADQLRPGDDAIGGKLGRAELLRIAAPVVLPGTGERKRARLGRWSMRRVSTGGAKRVEVIRERLDGAEWGNAADLKITAVDAESGKFVVFDRDSGVSLAEAVAASCAVPMVWPAVTIGQRHYIDGGVRSMTNTDVALGAERVVVIAPFTDSFSKATSIEAQLGKVGPRAAEVISPDQRSLTAIGKNVLDPAKGPDAARAGHRQGTELAEQVARVWRG